MKKKTVVLYIGIGCLLAALVCLSYLDTRRQMLEVAERVFLQAINEDLDERWKALGDSFSYHAGKEKKQYTKVDINLDNHSSEACDLKDIDLSQNVDEDFLRRCFHSYLLAKNRKICPDSLNARWQQMLMSEVLKTKTEVVICYDDKDFSIVCDSLQNQTSYIQLPVCFAGVMNEIQLNGFVRISFNDILRYNPLLWIYGSLFVGWLIVLIGKGVADYRRSLVSFPEGGACRLSKDVVYCPNSRCFIKGTEKITLSPKSNLIIKALLEAENHQLHGADLLAKVWDSNEANMNKLYIQNTKLRKALEKLGRGFDVVNIDRGCFRLLYPFSDNTL